MDHAIADSHASVTISHSPISSHRHPPKSVIRGFRPYGTDGVFPDSLSYFGMRVTKERKSPVSAVHHP